MGIENCPAQTSKVCTRRGEPGNQVRVTLGIACPQEGCRLSPEKDVQGPVILRFPSAVGADEAQAKEQAQQNAAGRKAEHCLFAGEAAATAAPAPRPQAPGSR